MNVLKSSRSAIKLLNFCVFLCFQALILILELCWIAVELVAVVEVGGVVDRVNDNPRRTRGGSDLPTWQLVLEVSLNTYTFKC